MLDLEPVPEPAQVGVDSADDTSRVVKTCHGDVHAQAVRRSCLGVVPHHFPNHRRHLVRVPRVVSVNEEVVHGDRVLRVQALARRKRGCRVDQLDVRLGPALVPRVDAVRQRVLPLVGQPVQMFLRVDGRPRAREEQEPETHDLPRLQCR